MARVLASFVLVLMASSVAHAHDLADLDAVHRACRAVRDPAAPRLYSLRMDPGFAFRPLRDGHLAIDTRRNLRALDGHVSVLLTGLEGIAFEAPDTDRASALVAAVRAGARLRLGFFLGFDEPQRQACLVRNAHAVTTVRADLAFAELVDADGESIARVETDRFAAWQDDGGAQIEGQGPRGAVGAASFENGQAPPEGWRRALANAAARGRIAQCHAEGMARGASSDGRVVVRLNVETRTGRVRRADVALSSLGDDDEAQCIARALGSEVQLPIAPPDWRAEAVDLAVPVVLTAD